MPCKTARIGSSIRCQIIYQMWELEFEASIAAMVPADK